MQENINILSIIIFLSFACIFSIQTYLFNIVHQFKFMNLRFNSSLQLFSILNFVGSFFWCYIGDKTSKHSFIQAFNLFMYILSVIVLFLAGTIRKKILQIIPVIFITMWREFTLGGVLPVFYALTLNYIKRNEILENKLSLINIYSVLGSAFVMLIMFILSYLKII